MDSWSLTPFCCVGGPLDGQVFALPRGTSRLDVRGTLQLHGYVQGQDVATRRRSALLYVGVTADGDQSGTASGDQWRVEPE